MTREEQKQIADFVRSCIHEIITESGADKNAHTNEVLRKVAEGIEALSAEPCVGGDECKEVIKAYFDGQADTLDGIKAEIKEEADFAYADFERYKVECLGQDWEDAYDSLPQDDFRYGMLRALEIINRNTSGKEEE